MLKTKKDLLITEINKSAQTGHQVTKIFTSSHSNTVTRVGCSCGNQHPVFKSGEFAPDVKVIWSTNLEKVS